YLHSIAQTLAKDADLVQMLVLIKLVRRGGVQIVESLGQPRSGHIAKMPRRSPAFWLAHRGDGVLEKVLEMARPASAGLLQLLLCQETQCLTVAVQEIQTRSLRGGDVHFAFRKGFGEHVPVAGLACGSTQFA